MVDTGVGVLGTGLWSLVQALSLGFCISNILGHWPCSPRRQKCLWNQADAGPTKGLDPMWMGAFSWRQGPTLGHVPPWAPASKTL